MSRVFEDLQQVQRGIDARRPGSGGRPVTETHTQARSKNSDYSGYPALDRTALGDGYRMCVRNASRLIADAKASREAGRYRSAYLILLLALEELGAALQLYEAGHSGVQDWEAWWDRYASHPKKLESTVLDLPPMEQAGERIALFREELVYVDFDKDDRRFKAPRDDDDTELPQLFDQEAAYAEAVLTALPARALERWEFEEMLHQSPEIARSALYALIEERVSHEPTVSEQDLLTTTARDLGISPDSFAAGYQRWKDVAPKARVYLDVLRLVEDKRRKGGREGKSPLKATRDAVDTDSQARLAVDYPADTEYQTASPPAFDQNPIQADEIVREPASIIVEDAGSPHTQDEAQQEPPVKPQTFSMGGESTIAPDRAMHGFIPVRYQNTSVGQVDDVTLDGLIESKRITHFFRPSEDTWVDISAGRVRQGARTNTTEHRRRASDGELKGEDEEKPHRFLRSIFRPSEEPAVAKKRLNAQEWFEQGSVALHTTDDCEGAARAFAMSIRLNPTHDRAYVNRALAYERLGNTQQAIEDYTRAISVNPDDARIYFLRGLAFERLGMGAEAVADLKKAADLRFLPAYDLLNSRGFSS